MKILLVADPILPVPPVLYGGIERIIAQLIEALRQRGHSVHLVGLASSSVEVDSLHGWPAEDVSSKWATVRNALFLRRVVLDIQPNVVHSFARLAYLTGILRSSIPKIMSYQRVPGISQTQKAFRWSRGSLSFTGCSQYIRELGKPNGADWAAIHNFVDVRKFTFQPSIPPDAPLVFLSRLDKVKAPDTAIAIALQSKRHLILAGNRAEQGSDAEFFEKKVQPHLDHPLINWVGPVDDRQKNALLGQAAAMLVPIRWDEPFGIVFAEALACGTPVISSPRGALPEIVTPGETGFLIDGIASGVAAVNRIPELRRQHCREAAETRFNVDQVVSRYLSLYETKIQGTR